MLRFKQFILEYLTPEQDKTWSRHKMSEKARADTDHFFGKGVDHKREEINHYDHDKSEVHKAVESHLGKELTHDEYKQGKVKDKHGRKVRIGKVIKDPKLLNSFSQDNTRAGKRLKPHMTIVRGHHVAGQTNSAPDAQHPTGHSWESESCKKCY